MTPEVTSDVCFYLLVLSFSFHFCWFGCRFVCLSTVQNAVISKNKLSPHFFFFRKFLQVSIAQGSLRLIYCLEADKNRVDPFELKSQKKVSAMCYLFSLLWKANHQDACEEGTYGLA